MVNNALGLFTFSLIIGSFLMELRVLIKLSEEQGCSNTIIGALFVPITLYWGWKNADRLNLRTWMTVWTIIVMSAVFLMVTLISQMEGW